MQQAQAWAAQSPPASAAAIQRAWRVEASLWQRLVSPAFDLPLRKSDAPVSKSELPVSLRLGCTQDNEGTGNTRRPVWRGRRGVRAEVLGRR